jgi:hypothetical protein
MPWILFLDDVRMPNLTYPNQDTLDWIICRSFADAVSKTKSLGCPNKILFDHDLGENETGFDFAKWLINEILNGMQIPNDFSFEIHSMNPIGSENIKQLMNGFLQHIKEM